MGVELLTAAMGGMALLNGIASYSASSNNAKAQRQAVRGNYDRQIVEIGRRQNDQVTQADLEKQDRVAQGTRELGTLRVAAAEAGLAGSTFTALAKQIGYFEGVDLSRVDLSLESAILSGESEKQAAGGNLADAEQSIALSDRAGKMGAVLGTVGSGLQIGTGYVTNQRRVAADTQSMRNAEELARNRKPS